MPETRNLAWPVIRGCKGGIGGLFSPRRPFVDRGPDSTFTSDEWNPRGDEGCSLQPHCLADRCANDACTTAKFRFCRTTDRRKRARLAIFGESRFQIPANPLLFFSPFG
jgi:hypothetical protein